jgi:hypothetical protein
VGEGRKFGPGTLWEEARSMKAKRRILARISFALIAWIGLLTTIAATALTYSGSKNREAVSAVARAFFAQMWKDSQAQRQGASARVTATPDGRIIQ